MNVRGDGEAREEGMKMTKRLEGATKRGREQGGGAAAEKPGIIQLGETIGLCLTTVWRGHPHTAP